MLVKKEGLQAPCHSDICQGSPDFSLEISQITLLLHVTPTMAVILDWGQEIKEEMDPRPQNGPTCGLQMFVKALVQPLWSGLLMTVYFLTLPES